MDPNTKSDGPCDPIEYTQGTRPPQEYAHFLISYAEKAAENMNPRPPPNFWQPRSIKVCLERARLSQL